MKGVTSMITAPTSLPALIQVELELGSRILAALAGDQHRSLVAVDALDMVVATVDESFVAPDPWEYCDTLCGLCHGTSPATCPVCDSEGNVH